MNFIELSVKRPVTTIMVYIGFCLFGMISLTKLPQTLYPKITFPQLTVMTRYGNAAPEEIETLITKVIEEAVGTVNNLSRILSKSREGVSLVTTEFNWGTNMDLAALSLREKIDLVKSRLPRDAKDPVVLKFNPLDLPLILLTLSGNRTDVEMLNYAKKLLKEPLEKINGVASCTITGGREREIHVNIDQWKMMAAGISIDEISEALSNDNLNYPAGSIKEKFYEYLIRSIGEYKTFKEIGEMPLYLDDRDLLKRNDDPRARYMKTGISRGGHETSHLGKRLVFLSDISSVKDSKRERQSYSRFNGKSNLSLSLQKQSGQNAIEVATAVKKKIDSFKKDMRVDISLKMIYDQSLFIKQAIWGVIQSIWQGGLIAFLILLYFLKNFSSALIVGISIPISVILTFSLMSAFHLSINMMSLSGLALGIGMMVDNSIVVMENITRLRNAGKRSEESAIDGTSEVSMAVFSSTLTTIAVFLPMVFVIGIAGQLFTDLSLTVVFSLFVSLLVSLTLIPRLSKNISSSFSSSDHLSQSRWKNFLEKPFTFMEKCYHKALTFFLKFRFRGLFLIFLLFVSTLPLVIFLKKELLPKIDQGEFSIKINMPAGTVLEETNKVSLKIENILKEEPSVKSVSVQIGSDKSTSSALEYVDGLESNEAEISVTLKEKRKEKTSFVIQKLRKNIDTLALKKAKVNIVEIDSGFGSLGSGEASAPILIQVTGTDLEKIHNISKILRKKLKRVKGIVNIKDDFAEPSPETRVIIDKKRASLHGMSVTDISQTAQIAIKGVIATKFKEDGKEINVIVRLRKEDRKNFPTLRNINIRSKNLKINIPLKELAKLERSVGPSEIIRKDQQRTITVSADLSNRSLDKVLPSVQQIIRNIRLPSEYKLKLTGESEKMKASFNSLKFALLLSILLVYMIMASQFESLWQPLIIMFSLPLALIGVFITLFITGTTLNIMVILGIIMLSGIVVNNAIVLITTANEIRESGSSAYNSIFLACKMRFRPILMTTLTTVLGLFPLALEFAKGSEIQSPMAKTVMGGLTVATFLTLFVIPSIYLISEHMIQFFFKKSEYTLDEDSDMKFV